MRRGKKGCGEIVKLSEATEATVGKEVEIYKDEKMSVKCASGQVEVSCRES